MIAAAQPVRPLTSSPPYAGLVTRTIAFSIDIAIIDVVVLVTGGIVALSLLIAIIGGASGNRVLARRALYPGGAMLAVYALFWGLGFVLAPTTVLAPGKDVSFCGLDCHLHVSVAASSPARTWASRSASAATPSKRRNGPRN